MPPSLHPVATTGFDNSLVIPGFGESAAAAGAGAARWCSAGVVGGMQGDMGPGADDTVSRFGGSKVLGFGGVRPVRGCLWFWGMIR